MWKTPAGRQLYNWSPAKLGIRAWLLHICDWLQSHRYVLILLNISVCVPVVYRSLTLFTFITQPNRSLKTGDLQNGPHGLSCFICVGKVEFVLGKEKKKTNFQRESTQLWVGIVTQENTSYSYSCGVYWPGNIFLCLVKHILGLEH